MQELVITSVAAHTATLTLNLDAKRNPLSPAMRQALHTALEKLRNDHAVRSVILTGSGKAFCSGLDLESLADQTKFTAEQNRADSESLRAFFEYVYSFPKPTIAAVNGAAVAGGAGLALVCDLTLASTAAFICFSEVKIGFVPALVSVYLERLVSPKIMHDLFFTARRVNAAEAKALGLVNEVLEPGQLLERATALAAEINENSPAAVQMTKTLLLQSRDLSSDAALKIGMEMNAQARSTSDCIEGVQAFFQKRKPVWGK